MDALNKNINTVIKNQSKKYISYCGTESSKKYAEAGWDSLRECLTDGRIHIVYSHNNQGEPDKSLAKRGENQDVKFTSDDKDILLDSIYNGAQVSLLEDNHVVVCAEAAVKDVDNKEEGVCSSHDRIFANWGLPVTAPDAEYNRWLTNGHREYVYYYAGRQTEHDAIISQQPATWFVRY